MENINRIDCPLIPNPEMLTHMRFYHIKYYEEILNMWHEHCKNLGLKRLDDGTYNYNEIVEFARYTSRLEQKELLQNTQYARFYLDLINSKDNSLGTELNQIIQFVDPYTDLDLSTFPKDFFLDQILREELLKILAYFKDQLGFSIERFDNGYSGLNNIERNAFGSRLTKVMFNILNFIFAYQNHPNLLVKFSEDKDSLCEEPTFGKHCTGSLSHKFPDSVSPADEKYKKILGSKEKTLFEVFS